MRDLWLIRTASEIREEMANTIALKAELMEGTAPEAIRRHSGMISQEERQFLYNWTAREYAGKGVIVDAGVFFGASTLCFGEGIRANPRCMEILSRWPQPIRSYERGLVRAGMLKTFQRHGIVGDYPAGSSFMPVVEEKIAPVRDLVDMEVGDILDVKWSGAPIEFLFLDIIKNRDIHLHVLKEFFPHLLPGAIVFHQDYFIETQPFVKATQEALSEHFDFVAQLSSTGVFQLRHALPPAAVAQAQQNIPWERQLDLLDATRDRIGDPARRLLVEISKVNVLRRDPDKSRAIALFEELAARVPPEPHWRLNSALDRTRELLGLPRLRGKGEWRPDRGTREERQAKRRDERRARRREAVSKPE